MSALPSTRSDIPMIPVPVFPHNGGFMPAAVAAGGDNSALLSKAAVAGVRGMQGGHMAAAALTVTQEPLQLLTTEGLGKAGRDQGALESTEAVDPNRLKLWSPEETLELIQLYKKYLPEFHQFGQRKMNVWQRVTEEMVAKGYGNFSWAECSAKFRSLRDSYRRSSAGGGGGSRGGQPWPYFAIMKDVMKTEKTILEQEPAARGNAQKGVVIAACQTDVLHAPSLPFPTTVPASATAAVTLSDAHHHPPASLSLHQGEGEATQADMEEPGRKRVSLDAGGGGGPAVKKSKDCIDDQDVAETVLVVGRDLNNGEVGGKGKGKKAGGGAAGAPAVGVMGSLQALGRSLSMPQCQLVVGEDGQVVQTTSTPTGLFLNDGGQMVSGQPGNRPSTGGGGGGGMPQWFKLYEKRTRAENSRRLEELKAMHRQTLELQKQTLEVARHKNQLLKTLAESLDQFKALLQHR